MDEIICGHVLDVLKQIPDESIDCVVTSPPYWSLRDYKTNGLIWDGDEDCEHEWEAKITKQDNLRYRVGNKIPQPPLKKGVGGLGKGENNTTVGNNINPVLYPNNMVPSNFCIKCGAWRGSLGLEPTFALYLKHLLQIFDEVKRVLKKTGTCWINLGDTYRTHTSKRNGQFGAKIKNGFDDIFQHSRPNLGMEKSLCLIPQRFAIAMIDSGWILRNTIIWHKPNCMPASAKDRFTVDFEYVFFFAKSKKYYFEQQFESIQFNSVKRLRRAFHNKDKPYAIRTQKEFTGYEYVEEEYQNHQGRNRRCVWTIPTSPFKDAHFATFPEALVEPMIKAGCPEFVCKKCGKTREKIIVDTGNLISMGGYGSKTAEYLGVSPTSSLLTKKVKEKKEIGYSDCGCNAGFDNGIVLDPFIGSGTTAVVALKLNRHYLGIELNEEYCQMARKRIVQQTIQLNLEAQNAELMREINQ